MPRLLRPLALTTMQMPTPEALRRQVEDIREVGTLPHVMSRILEVIANERASAQDLSDEIVADPGLTAKILKIVNSAFYGFYREIALISDAVVVLGFEEIQRISLAISVVGMLGKGSAREADRIQFWNHCFYTAAMAELLERELGRGGQGAFTAGLLHDIGRAVLDQHFPDIYQEIVATEKATGRLPADVEQQLLGTTHAEIGFWLAERWHLPPLIAEAMRYHHALGKAGDAVAMAATVHLADVLVHRLTEVGEENGTERQLDPLALETLNVAPAQLEEIQLEFNRRIETGDSIISDLVRA